MTEPSLLAVSTQSITLQAQAQTLATTLDCPYTPFAEIQTPLVLELDKHGLALWQREPTALGPLRVDFNSPTLLRRCKGRRAFEQDFVRAIGLKRGQPLRVLDLTAGLGRDGFILASLGAEVTLLERSPILAAMLREALGSLPKQFQLTLHEGEAQAFLSSLAPKSFDVIYYDPMYPERRKPKAQVKMPMQILQALLGEGKDDEALLQLALQSACKRVVVKRPRHAKLLTVLPNPAQIIGKSTRYDFVLTHGL